MFVDIFNTNKRYSIIYADPPWKYDGGIKNCTGAAQKHYDTMTAGEIVKIPVEALAAKDCILFMWATYPKYQDALELIQAWGFKYKTIAFQWVKLNPRGIGYFFGMGRWTRGNTEPCLLAVRGKPKRVSAAVSQLIVAPVGKHSEKPAITRTKIRQLVGQGAAIELFARKSAPGWDCWGNEAPGNNCAVAQGQEPAEDGQTTFY